MFHNRLDAAQLLLEELQHYRGEDLLVLAIPRGAVPMGRTIALGLGGALDVVLVRKLGAPLQPELAIGAIDENGWTYLTDHATHHEVSADYIAAEKPTQLQTLRARRAQQPARLVCGAGSAARDGGKNPAAGGCVRVPGGQRGPLFCGAVL
jgi:predicted phosphoribosyltransferase